MTTYQIELVDDLGRFATATLPTLDVREDAAPATRQTAGNNADLARIKKAMNAPIFRKASAIYNDRGRDACREYMGRFFNPESRQRCLSSLFVD